MDKAKQKITIKEANIVLKNIGESCKHFQRIENDTGVINPLYLLTTNKGNEYILKVTNKHWKQHKTCNEATVLDFVKKNTTIPVPKVHVADCVGKEIGHEYLLMEKMPGVNLSQFYGKMTNNERKVYLNELASYLSQLRKYSFKKIGSFQKNMRVGLHADICKGPFNNYAEYMTAIMNARIKSLRKNSRFKKYVSGLKNYRDRVIKPYDAKVPIVLTHADLYSKNILIHDGHISAILDWEWSAASSEDEEFYCLRWIKGKEKKYFINRLKKYGVINEPDSIKSEIHTVCFTALAFNAYLIWYVGKERQGQTFIQKQEKALMKIFKKHHIR